MSWWAGKLNTYAEIRSVERTPVSSGGFDWTYKIDAQIWVRLKLMSRFYRQNLVVRDRQVSEAPTHIIQTRRDDRSGICTRGEGALLKAGKYIYVPTGDSQGRNFKIHSITDIEERGEMLEIEAEEVSFQTDSMGLAK